MTPSCVERARHGAAICGAVLTAAALTAGCASAPGGGSFHLVQFRAPSTPDPELQALLSDTGAIGILSATNIEPVQGLDIEKVMGRLTDAIARALRKVPDRKVVTQDEIRWQFEGATFDSAAVFDETVQASLRDSMDIDALVYVLVRRLEAKMTPVSPGPYGMTANPGVNISVDLELSLINLHTGQSWSQQRQQSNWQPIQLPILGGGTNDRAERQLLAALSDPLRQFLVRLAPPPSLEGRHFDLTGD